MANRTRFNERDLQLLELMKEFHILTSKTASIYFSGKNPEICSARRLKKIYEQKNTINRYRESVTSEFIYYYGRRRNNWKHDLTRLEAFTALKSNSNISIVKYKLEKEFVINGSKSRCDLLVIVKNKFNNITPILLEIDISHRYNNKYKDLNNSYFGNIEPLIISISRFSPNDITGKVLHLKPTEIDKLKELTF